MTRSTASMEYVVEWLTIEPVKAQAVWEPAWEVDYPVAGFDTLRDAVEWAERSVDRTGRLHRIERDGDTVWESDR